MFQPLDGPSKQYTLSVADNAVSEIVKPAGSAQAERKVITLQSEDGKFRVFFGDGSGAPSIGVIKADGILQHRIQLRSYECGDSQKMYLISESGTINIHVVERA